MSRSRTKAQPTAKKTKPTRRRTAKKKKSPTKQELHPWRLCPYGQHWVVTHPLHVPPSRKDPDGSVTTRHGHCADNSSGKDQLYPDEIGEIAAQHFRNLANKPCPLALKYPNGGKYDDYIAGWVQYWNEVFKPAESLDPNLAKALIATESRFEPSLLADKKDRNSARGLMQVTNKTRKILDNTKGEIKEHYITATREQLNDPNVNICAGIRWLFHKRALASSHLGRQATWEETVAEYKGTSIVSEKRAKELMDRFREKYEAYKKCGK